jgi:hypothetical protein
VTKETITPAEIRTRNLRIRSPLLCPVELRALGFFEFIGAEGARVVKAEEFRRVQRLVIGVGRGIIMAFGYSHLDRFASLTLRVNVKDTNPKRKRGATPGDF